MAKNRTRFLDWNIYQIYLRSFLDSDDDGIGDLEGVRQKLDYLQSLGINAVWISPCYPSPGVDNGYDISDYYAIDEKFGGFSAWEALKDDLHARGMKLIMDLVLNHTSSQHPWFQSARQSVNSPFHEYYIWAKTPPNDWQSVFGGSAWTYNGATQEYYLHSFAAEQPDLNWQNPSVRKECCAIVDFWIRHGVDGFRCDVLDFIAKDFRKNKMYDGARLHDYIRQLFDRPSAASVFTLGECKSTADNIVKICGKHRRELTAVFQFDHIGLEKKDKYTPGKFSLEQLKRCLLRWQTFAQEKDLFYVLFTDNHDRPFFLSRLGNDASMRYERATMLATLFYLLRGIPVVYQGQEFGCVNSVYTDISRYQDVETLQYYTMHRTEYDQTSLWKKILFSSRDQTRRPMAWNANEDTVYGFTDKKPWLAPPSSAKEINLETDVASPNSVFKFYQTLFALRNSSLAVRRGKFENVGKKENCFIYKRYYRQEELYVLCNFEKPQKLPVPEALRTGTFHSVLQNYPDRTDASPPFRPYEVVVYAKKARSAPLQKSKIVIQ